MRHAVRTAGLLVAFVLGGSSLAPAADRTPREPPFESEGEVEFALDLAAFQADSARVAQEIYLAVPNDQLAFRHEEETWRGELRFEVTFRDEHGDEVFATSSDLQPVAAERLDAEDRAIVQAIRERALLRPGLYHLEVRLTDLRSERTGLLDRIRNLRNKGRVETWIRVPDLDGAGVSEIVFVRNAHESQAGDSWARQQVDFDPNPSRFYGLAVPHVRCFAEVYADSGFQSGDSFLIQSQVMDPGGLPLLERVSRARPDGETFGIAEELSLEKRIAAGTYRFALTVLNERTGRTSRTERPFEVLWAVESWGREPDAGMQEMALVMTDAEYDDFQKLAPGAREIYLAEFWHRLDPDPTTPENEVLREFKSRVAFADRQFASPTRRGVLTDRGRVHVRYGKPDDETYQFSSSSFGSVEGALEKVSEPGERATLGSRPSVSVLDADEFREGDVSDLTNQRGGATVKSQQLVVWTYDGRGAPLRPGHQELTGRSPRGLKFVFSDPMGNGDFQVIGSSGTSVY